MCATHARAQVRRRRHGRAPPDESGRCADARQRRQGLALRQRVRIIPF